MLKRDERLIVCQICGEKVRNMPRYRKGMTVFDVLKHHLMTCHNKTIEDYMEEFFQVEKHVCKCGCGQFTKLAYKNCQMFYNDYLPHHIFQDSDFISANSEKMKIERKGANNPQYGKHSWNFGKKAENDASMKKISNFMKNRTVSRKTREKLKLALIKRRENGFKGNEGNKHSEETKKLLKQLTLLQLSSGKMKQTNTVPHQKVCLFLKENNIYYVEEKVSGFFSFDIFLVDFNIYIEVDGDYWHANPKFYSNVPLTKTQKINIYRDERKNEFVKENKLVLLRFWEDDIINNFDVVKENILKKIKEIKDNEKQ